MGRLFFMLMAGGVAEQPIDGQTGVWLKSGGVTISSAMTMTGAVVSSGQKQFVYSKGEARYTQCLGVGDVLVSNGGVASNCYISGGINAARLMVIGGGTAVSCVLQNGDIQLNGYPAAATLIDAVAYGGRLILQNYANVSNCTKSGGSLEAGAGGGPKRIYGLNIYGGGATIYNNTIVYDLVLHGGSMTVRTNGKVSGATIQSAAPLTVSSGGTVTSLTVESGGSLTVSSGGLVVSGTVSGTSALADVSSGGAASAITIQSGGRVNIWPGGSATDITTDFGIFVLYGGTVSNLSQHGSSVLLPNGSAFNVSSYDGMCVVGPQNSTTNILAAGGNVHISGRAASITVVRRLQVFNGGTATAVVVSSGGTLTVSSGGSALTVNAINTPTVNTVINSGYISGLHLHNASAASLVSDGYLDDVLLTADSGGYATRLSCWRGSAGSVTMSSGTIFSVRSGAVVDEVTVNGSSYLSIEGSYTVHKCIVNSGSIVSAFAGTFDELVVNSRANFTAGSGCSITTITAGDGSGTITVVSGGELSDKILHTIGIGYNEGAVGSNLTVGASALISVRTPYISGMSITSGGMVSAYAGGVLSGVSATQSGYLFLNSGASADGVTLDAGICIVSSNATMTDVTVSGPTPASRGQLNIRAGGIVSGARLYTGEGVYNNGTLNDLTIYNGVAYMRSPGIASGVVLNDGVLVVSSGASALAVTSNGGTVTKLPGGYVEYVTS